MISWEIKLVADDEVPCGDCIVSASLDQVDAISVSGHCSQFWYATGKDQH